MLGYISFSIFESPQLFRTSPIRMLHDHSQSHHTDYNSFGRVIIPTYRMYLITHNIPNRQTAISRGIRNHKLGKTLPANPRLNPHGQYFRLSYNCVQQITGTCLDV